MPIHLKDKIKQLAKAHHAKAIEMRRHLHMNPELSFHEYNTSKYIQKCLSTLGIEYKTGFADTGIVAIVKGKNPNKAILALRADIDALPITEANDTPYKSLNVGTMHACGHDVHTASLISVASMLNSLKEEFEGSVKFLFQPAEEVYPGGALGMIRDGALDSPTPASIIGQHVHVPIEAGKIAFCKGPIMASTDNLHLVVKGKGGHAASPHRSIDPILVAAHIIVSLQQIVSRHSSPLDPSVLSICMINAGTADNIIPEEVKMYGTFRSLDEEWRKQAHEKIRMVACGVASAMGAECHLEIRRGYPSTYNDHTLTDRCILAAQDFLGKDNVIPDIAPLMGAEDFAYYAQKLPGCYYLLGVGNRIRGINSYVHTPTFDIDEDAMETSIGLMTWLSLSELKNLSER
jgi:amidohydrolase